MAKGEGKARANLALNLRRLGFPLRRFVVSPTETVGVPDFDFDDYAGATVKARAPSHRARDTLDQAVDVRNTVGSRERDEVSSDSN